jgi:ferritin-like metal-binding protein YciE
MGLFTSEQFDSLDELFLHHLKDLYDAEHRITDALPNMAAKASSPALKQAFENHLQETERQIERLEMVFETLGKDPERVKCNAMAGLIAEGKEVLDATGDADVLDAALIAAAQRVEHYEIAGYGTARAFAQRLGNAYAAELLQQTLNEEGAADHKLTSIAEGGVNAAAL